MQANTESGREVTSHHHGTLGVQHVAASQATLDGVEHTTAQLGELLEQGVPGVHFYAMNRTHSVSKVLENVGIVPRIIP